MALSSVSITEDKFLGKGAYGSVYLHYDKKNNAWVADKRIDVGPVESEDVKITKVLKVVRKEISMMKDLNHKRIVRYIREGRESNIYSIYMEYVSGGSVENELIKNGALSEDTTKKYTLQLLEGLSYLHGKLIIHRDVKGSNILCDGNGNIKLADFGISKQMKYLHTLTSKASKNTAMRGTAYWMAPEVIKAEHYETRADIWSTGATVVEMLTAHPPWYKLEQMQAMFKIASLEEGGYALNSRISRDAEDFLSQIFRFEEQRPRADELLQHSWLKAVYVLQSEEKTDAEAMDSLSDVQKHEASANVERTTPTELDVRPKVVKDGESHACSSEDGGHGSGRERHEGNQMDTISKSIPPAIIAVLTAVCEDHSVESYSIKQDPDDWQCILIFGKNARLIPEAKVAEAVKDTCFKVIQANSNDSFQMMLPSLSIIKQTWENNAWTPGEVARCELLVSAEKQNVVHPNIHHRSSFAIGPAHMLLKDSNTRSLFANVGTKVAAQIEVESQSTRTSYIILAEELETGSVNVNHPLLFSYRYWCQADTIGCKSCRELTVGDHLDDIRICSHMLMNDLVLLPLEKSNAEELQSRLNRIFNDEIGPIVCIGTIGELQAISEMRMPIRVGNYRGQLIPNKMIDKERRTFIGYHLKFILCSVENQENIPKLVSEDCGRIVYCKLGTKNLYRPLGMMIGRLKATFSTPVYQAILLHQAIKDIEYSYPQHVKDVEIYQ